MNKKHQKNRKQLAVRITATALAAILTVGAAQPLTAHAAEAERGGIRLLAEDTQKETRTKTLYTVGNTSYENNASTPKGNGHDCQHLGIWVPAGVTFKIRQTNKNLGQNLTVKMRNDDRFTEAAYTLKSDGSWLEITHTADSVPLISSVYNAKGEKPVVEYTIEGTQELPVYHFGDDELAFYQKWDELDAPFAVFLSDYTIWLVPARDKTKNNVGSLDDLLLWYDNMIRQYNAFSGLSLDAAEEWNRDSGTKYFIKANRNSWGAAYYSVVETAPNGDSLWGYMDTGNWGPLHEVGHGYNTVNFNSAEIWNNVLSHYYQVAALGAGRWLGLSEKDRAGYEEQRSTLDYFGTQDYHAKLYFWVNMLDKLGAQKTSAYAYQLFRGNKANGIANLGGHDFYVDAYTKGSGYNVSAWFDLWGFTVEDSTKEVLIEAETYQNVYPLRNLVTDDATAETIRAALGLASKYSLVETQELQAYFKTAAPINGTLNIHLDNTALEAIKDQKIRITDGVNTVHEVEVTGADLNVELPIGYYNILVPSPVSDEPVILQNRLGYAVVTQNGTAKYEITAEKITGADSFTDYTLTLGTTYGGKYNYCVATTDMANKTLRIVNSKANPHAGYGGNPFSSITVYDKDGNVVYQKIHTGSGNLAGDETIDIDLGYRIELTHQEPWRGIAVRSSAMSSVELLNNNVSRGAPATFEVTERGLREITPTEIDAQDSYNQVLCAYMDKLKDTYAKADFHTSAKFPEEKAKVNAAFQNLTAEQQAAFKTAYEGYYPFDQGVREMTIAAIPAQDYTGSPVTPELDVTVNGTKLTDSDYRAEWTLNTDVGTARVKVYGTGTYEDCIGEETFEIRLPDSLPKEFTVVSEYASVEFSSGAKRPSATVTIGGKELTRGVDYILAYANNTSVGMATITANGIGNYAGISGSTTFEITNKIVDMTVTVSPAKVNLDASGATTGVTVMVGKKQLTAGTDYTVSFSDNTAVGTATATVTGIGNYAGSVGSATYEVTQPLNPDPIGGTVFSNWKYIMNGYTASRYSQMTFDFEAGTLTVQHGSGKPHVLINGAYATISVYDTDDSRSYHKVYLGNTNNYAPADTVKLGIGYIVGLTFAEPGKGGSKVYSSANSAATLAPKTARYVVTARGLKEITADGSTASGDMASNYTAALYAYMDQLKKDNPVQEDFWDAAKFPEQKAIVEKGVTLLTAEELAQFKEDYAGYYPFAAPVRYTVEYDWGTEFPDGETLPEDGTTYRTEEAALAAMDTAYTDKSTSNAPKGDLTGSWKFSGWTGKLDGTTVRFTGKWTFTADVPLVDAKAPAAITLTDAEYEEGQTATALNGKTTVTDNGTITYQWYSSDAVDNFNGTAIDGETGETFTPNTDAAGTYYYYVIATNTLESATGNKAASTTSGMATITVKTPAIPVTYTVTYDWGDAAPADAQLPTDTDSYDSITAAKEAVKKQPYDAASTSVSQKDGKTGTWRFSGWTATVDGTTVKFTGTWAFEEETTFVDAEKPAAITLMDATYTVGDTPTDLNGETTVTDGGEITYQWYKATSKTDVDGTPLNGETEATFTPDTSAAGTFFYYVEATNTNDNATGSRTATVCSTTAQITVQEPAPAERFAVRYVWDGEAPSDVSLPVNGETYDTAEEAEAAMDTTYTDGFTSNAQKDGKDGTWTFSGWTATVDGNTVTFAGSWSFVEKETPVDPVDPVDPKPPVTPSRPSVVGRPSVRPQPTQSSKPALPFTDVRSSAWYYDAVQYLHETGILSGVRANTFAPNLNTTRGMITTMLHRLEQEPSASAANPFTDAQYGYYAAAVRWALQAGIVTGTSDTRFSPNAPMTREQLAAVLYRYAQNLGRDTSKTASLNTFTDSNTVSFYAREAVSWAVAEGILGGVGSGRLAPTAPATRAQVAEILYRFLRDGKA